MPSRSLNDADPRLVEKFDLLNEDFVREHPGQTLAVTCTYRSLAEQLEAYNSGHSQLKKGNHNVVNAEGNPCSRAIDVMVVVDKKGTWDVKYYAPLIELAQRHGLVSGGSWPHFKDWPHIELPKDTPPVSDNVTNASSQSANATV
jgi:hypothetical protein